MALGLQKELPQQHSKRMAANGSEIQLILFQCQKMLFVGKFSNM